MREWIGNLGVKTAYIEPGTPWENGYSEGFNGKLRDELLVGKGSHGLKEAQIPIERWRRHYNEARWHSAPVYGSPAPQVIMSANNAKEFQPN